MPSPVPPTAITRRAALLAAVAVVAGCTETVRSKPATTGNQQPQTDGQGAVAPVPKVPSVSARVDSVAMIGDSITALSQKALEKVFSSQGISEAKIDAQVSRRIRVGNGTGEPLNGEKVLANLLAVGIDPDVWVVALGTNDVSSYDAAELGELIDEMLTRLPEGVPAVWIDVFLPDRLDATDRFNTVLRERAASRPKTSVASWSAVASKDPKSLMSGDRIHPSDAGEVAFASLVGTAVAAAATSS